MPATVTITDPANNGDPFPDPVTGTYGGGGAVDVIVEITNEKSGQTTTYTATAAGGSWSLSRPPLSRGKYTITAAYAGASDSKTGIVG